MMMTPTTKALLVTREFFYVPSKPTQLHIFQACHNLPSIGYIGVKKTIKLISRDLW